MKRGERQIIRSNGTQPIGRCPAGRGRGDAHCCLAVQNQLTTDARSAASGKPDDLISRNAENREGLTPSSDAERR